MKRIVILFLAALFAASGASAQKFHNAYYDTRRAAHDEEGLQQGAIVFLGNSITEQGWWSLLLKRGDVENRGRPSSAKRHCGCGIERSVRFP